MTRIKPPVNLAVGFQRAGILSGLLIVLWGTGFFPSPQNSLAADPEAPKRVLSFDTRKTMSLGSVGLITGVTWVGTDTLAVLREIPALESGSGNREVQLLLRNRSGSILLREDFSGVLDRALAWDGEFLYSCGDAPDGSSILYQIQLNPLEVADAYDVPGHRPSGMCFDGQFVWISDRDTGRVDRFDPEARAITRSAITPGFSPFGMAHDGRDIWVTDSGTGRMYRLSGSRLKWSATVDTESYLFRGEDVLLLHDQRSFWYVLPKERIAVAIRFG